MGASSSSVRLYIYDGAPYPESKGVMTTELQQWQDATVNMS